MITRRIDQGQILPQWWGFCWFDHSRRDCVIAPIGLNVVLRFARALYLWMSRPVRFFDAVYEVDYLRGEVRRITSKDHGR